MYSDDEVGFEIQLSGWKAVAVVLFLVIGAFWMHYRHYYYNPDLEMYIDSLTAYDPEVIGEALYKARSLTMGKGYKLVPYLLPLLKDNRPLPEEIERKIIREIQSTPGALSGMGKALKGTFTIGKTAAFTLQSLLIVDLQKSRFVTGKARRRIVDYVIRDIGLNADEDSLAHGLLAVVQIRSKKLVPFWFKCLNSDSERIKTHALSGLYYYSYDRNHGLFEWHPEKEITSSMVESLKKCQNDEFDHIRGGAELVVKQLKKANFELY